MSVTFCDVLFDFISVSFWHNNFIIHIIIQLPLVLKDSKNAVCHMS